MEKITGVVRVGRRRSGTWNIEINNVEISGIYSSPRMGGFVFDTIDWFSPEVTDSNGFDDLYFTSNVANWVFETESENDGQTQDSSVVTLAEISDKIDFSCGSDIQSHVNKGAMGLKADAVYGLII